jgi:hypothetical protein
LGVASAFLRLVKAAVAPESSPSFRFLPRITRFSDVYYSKAAYLPIIQTIQGLPLAESDETVPVQQGTAASSRIMASPRRRHGVDPGNTESPGGAVKERIRELTMSCEFCQCAIEVVEDYVYHEGLAFHPQRPTENNICCSPTVRRFEEVTEVCHEL